MQDVSPRRILPSSRTRFEINKKSEFLRQTVKSIEHRLKCFVSIIKYVNYGFKILL